MRPLCLPVAPSADYAGREAEAAGWGRDEAGNNVNKLRRSDFRQGYLGAPDLEPWNLLVVIRAVSD